MFIKRAANKCHLKLWKRAITRNGEAVQDAHKESKTTFLHFNSKRLLGNRESQASRKKNCEYIRKQFTKVGGDDEYLIFSFL